jgi:hypothetical protein
VMDGEVVRDLVKLEASDPSKVTCFNVGVMYSKPGQTTEREMFDNGNAFCRFSGVSYVRKLAASREQHSCFSTPRRIPIAVDIVVISSCRYNVREGERDIFLCQY